MNKDLHDTIVETMFLFQETESFQRERNSEFCATLVEACAHLNQIRKRLLISNKAYRVAFVGLGNVGKSTLINALFGKRIAPAWNGPCTDFPIEFIHKDAAGFDVVVHSDSSGLVRQRRNFESCEDLIDYLDELTKIDAKEKAPRRVIVKMQSDLLSNGLVVVDTPGFGAIQFGEKAGRHEEVLTDYLRKETSQIFWVVSKAGGGIGKKEKVFYQNYLKDYCDDLIVTRAEDWKENVQARFIKLYREELESQFVNFHFVSATQGLEARETGNDVQFTASGVKGLHDRIQRLSDESYRSEQATRQFFDLLDNLVECTCESFSDHRGQPEWNPIRWANFERANHASPIKRMVVEKLLRLKSCQ